MNTNLPDEQEEEKEVLISIYGSDPNFKETGPATFQYKVGEDGVTKTFLIELTWPGKYPDEEPLSINLDTFYNRHLSPQTKQSIRTALLNEMELLQGSPMTYTLFEYCRDNVDDLIPDEELGMVGEELTRDSTTTTTNNNPTPSQTVKKKSEPLSKAAKRRQADKLNAQGELPRGWNWVDIISHLSKTGGAEPT